ncbi:hypothetical protein T11_16540 [Trichinella zimbabwensis]|uniref:Uncharacterized protein n=1 Tax=Trichinella zimbabwensis TaxID=268475 RepID=A0A0V1I6L5_9BILA|nr:hypothetical protein T11_16540 [Trichinella zimbabwensis]
MVLSMDDVAFRQWFASGPEAIAFHQPRQQRLLRLRRSVEVYVSAASHIVSESLGWSPGLTIRMRPVRRSLHSLNIKQAAHFPNEIYYTNASLITYNFFWYSHTSEHMTNQNFPEMDQGSQFGISASGCLAAEAKEKPLVSITYQVFSARSHHSWCTNPQSSLFDLARLKCLIQRATDNHWDKSHRGRPPTK